MYQLTNPILRGGHSNGDAGLLPMTQHTNARIGRCGAPASDDGPAAPRAPPVGTNQGAGDIRARSAGDDKQIVEEDNLESLAAPLAHALYIPHSPPRIFYAWSFTRPRRRNTKKYNEEPPPECSGEGGSSLHGQQLLHGGAGTPNEGQLGHASNTKACFDEKNDKADP